MIPMSIRTYSELIKLPTFEERYARFRSGDREMLTSHIENKGHDMFPITYIQDSEGYEFMDARFS